MSTSQQVTQKLTQVSKSEPCTHCNKPDWCYRLGELDVCKRGQIADGWEATSKSDKDGDAYLTKTEAKQTRVKSKKEYFYNDRDGRPLVKVTRVDDGAGKKNFYQSHWDGQKWATGNPDDIKVQIPIYRYDEVRDAIEAGEPIFVVEGEEIANLLWDINLAATTFIGGAGKYKKYGTNYIQDLQDAQLILCPDRDEPGVAHMEEVFIDFPDARWVYAPPTPFYWDNPPKSQGLDLADWILQDGATQADIMQLVGDKKPVNTAQKQVKTETSTKEGEAVYSADERLKLALLDLSQEKDRIAYIRKRADVCVNFRISKSEVEELVRDTIRKTSQTKLKRFTLKELLSKEVTALDWLIPELLPAGEMIILAGSPKAGKTLMALDAAFAIATGEDYFLGIPTKRGKVLIVSNDESDTSTQFKLLKRGLRADDTNIEAIFQWTMAQMYELEQVLDEYRPDIVIIDSLKSISTNETISENSAEFANNIYTLKNLFHQYKCASILIHHTNKNKDAMGVAKLRGSTAIAGAVWGTWQLEQIPKPDPNGTKGFIIDPADPMRTFSVFARDVEGQILGLEFDPENNSYKRTDEDKIKELNTLSERILKILSINKDGLSGRSVIECLGMAKEDARNVYSMLNRMETKLLISTKKSSTDKRVTLYIYKNSEHGYTENSEHRDSPSPSTDSAMFTNLNQTLTQQGIQNSEHPTKNSEHYTENSEHSNYTRDTYALNFDIPSKDSSELVNIVNSVGGGESPKTVLNNCTETQSYTSSQAPNDEIVTGSNEPISLLEIELAEGDVNGFVGCQVEIRSTMTSKVKFTGTMLNYDALNGSLKVARDDNDEVKLVHVREAFVTVND